MSKNTKEKMDLWSLKASNKFDDVLGFANKYKSIPEVQAVISELQASYQNYEQEIENLIRGEQTLIDEKYDAYEVVNKKKIVWIIALVGCVILALIANDNAWKLGSGWLLLFLLGIVVCLIGTLVFVFRSMFLYSQYEKCANASYEKIRRINYQYTKGFDSLYDEIDWMYLNSLDPVHRETILMRRDQERQHKERMQLMKEQHAEQMRLQQESLSRMENAQRQADNERRQMMADQKELLDIERQREDRYWNNRR